MAEGKGQRRHSAEFRVEIAQRMLAGENVVALSRQYELPRSMMYRWRDVYRREGAAGLARPIGKPAVRSQRKPVGNTTEQRLRERIAELERKVGQQAVEIDFFKGVFKRVEELPKAKRRGGTACTPSSDE